MIYLLTLSVIIQLSSRVLGVRRTCSLCDGSSGGNHVSLEEPCGVYLRPCAPGLRCVPPLGASSPLQELLRGRGACRTSETPGADVPAPTDYESSVTENNEKGPCRRLLTSVLQRLKLTVIHSDQDIYIPNCDRQGSFRRKQCRSSRGMQRGHCWCVDEDGSRILPRRRIDGTVSCSA